MKPPVIDLVQQRIDIHGLPLLGPLDPTAALSLLQQFEHFGLLVQRSAVPEPNLQFFDRGLIQFLLLGGRQVPEISGVAQQRW